MGFGALLALPMVFTARCTSLNFSMFPWEYIRGWPLGYEERRCWANCSRS